MTDLIISTIANAVLLAIAIFAVKAMLSWTMQEVKKMVDEFKTEFKSCVTDLKKEDQALWDAVNSHGHKALDQNGSRVTR